MIPFVEDPAAPKRLAGLSLSEAFRVCVLDDPDVQARGKELVARTGYHQDIFEQGRTPGPVITFIWPIETTQKSLEHEFTRKLIYFSGQAEPPTPDEVVKACAVLSDRWQALRALLIKGKLIAEGTFTKTGLVQAIPRQQWKRGTLKVDVQNSDVLEEIENEDVIVWSGVELVLPSVSEVEAPKAHEAVRKISDLPTPNGRIEKSIFHACQNLWPEGLPLGLTQKQRNDKIREEQIRLGQTPASESSLKRYFGRLRPI